MRPLLLRGKCDRLRDTTSFGAVLVFSLSKTSTDLSLHSGLENHQIS
jgi:hypothetical protein